MSHLQPRDFVLYYAGILLIALILFLRRRPGPRMRLRLRGSDRGLSGLRAPDRSSRVDGARERPLNVVFNYNGHSWDAYEVLGLPAGSSPDKVETAFNESMGKVDAGSKAFMQAAYDAIQTQWRSYRAAGGD